MKKIMYICLALLIAVVPFNIYADANEIAFHSIDENVSGINYDENPIVLLLDINGIERYVYVTVTEAYFYDDYNNKIILVTVEDIDDVYVEKSNITRAVSLNNFLNDFYYTNSFVPKEFQISKGLQLTIDGLTSLIAAQAVSYLGLPSSLGDYIIGSAKYIAYAIETNPPEYAIRLNIKYYRNKNCSTYLGGQTFNMVANGKTTSTMYSYTWEENPSLSVVSQACKLQNKTYPYQYGIGQ